ncbi:MAG: DedA family protein [Tetrasphaera sp.]|nr:DedA family protein [Tetrasphaera sp.]
MDAFLSQILDQPVWLIYAVVGLVVLVEDALFVGFVVPGETVAILGGVSASLGRTDVWLMGLIVVLAAVIGDSIGYEIGRIWGSRIIAHRFFDKRRARLDQAQEFLRVRGGSAVFLGRWTAFFRAVMPALAGTSRMRYSTFLPWNAVGGLAWGATVVALGFFAGHSYQKVATWFGGGSAAIVATIAAVALIVWQVRRRRVESTREQG